MSIKLVFTEVEQAANDIMNTVSQMENKLADLKRNLAPIRATWESEAQHEYDLRQAEWDSAADRIRDLLRAFSQSVKRVGGLMAETEAGNVAVWRHSAG